ncbi:hypothetical protein BJ912DRAFT_700513 [Pholiota molesta]|nr:hypothetical protein BJ912DRAFT_700513 [Pholiota molesta]
MWSKITSALKPNQAVKDAPIPAKDSSQSEVLNKVFEQHPNMSMFHTNESGIVDRSPSPPPSPSVHGKRNMFKRMSKAALKEDFEVQRVPSPFVPPSSISKKVRVQNDNNSSQHSLRASSTPSRDMPRRSSFDMLRPSPPRPDTTRSVKDNHRRPSIDFLRQETARLSEENTRPSDTSEEAFPPRSSSLDMLRSSPEAQYPQDTAHSTNDLGSRPSIDFLRQESLDFNRPKEDGDFLSTPAGLDKFGSKRSILRDRNTPGTGQNVRFIGRDAYKVITPDHSLSAELQNKPQPPLPQEETPFMDRLTQASAFDSPQTLERSQSLNSPKSSRPTVAEIFAPLIEVQENPQANLSADQSSMSISSYNHFVITENSNLFDVSQQLDIPSFPPPGLNFDVDAPMFDTSGNENSQVLAEGGIIPYSSEGMTSTPYRPQDTKGKGKEKTVDVPTEDAQVPVPVVIDETIFHAKERSPKFAAPLHERSQSFSFGQTIFYSMANSGGDATKSASDHSAAYPSSELKPGSVTSSSAAPTPPSAKGRSRALSDTVFQSMLRSTPPKIIEPEADINDDSSSGLVVYSGGEPDPFSTHATTYYTPQTMIPTTPPKGFVRHNRKTSKEENLIISLQTQLALRNELCSQYEADLKARDELVEILGKKLSDAEKDDAKRKAALRSWKRKVQDLEKACRQLEEAVEDSRQMSMERSVMDEASSEALRMLHRQIAGLEKEKGDWAKREAALREEVETLEGLVRERSEDVMNLKESLWSRDESERELKEGIQEAKEQIDMMGNISVGVFDEEELKRLMMEKEQKSAEETQRFRTAEFALKQELADVKMKCEGLEVQKASWEEELENVNQLLKTREEEYAVLKSELEAQWQHTEVAGEKVEALEKERAELEKERDELKAGLEELETRMSTMEVEWQESENRRQELDNELQEVWNLKDALEKDREELEDTLHQERERTESLEHDIEERDQRISELEQEHQFATENVTRLQENLQQRDAEILQHTQRVLERENDAERLREEMSTLKREYQRLVNEQTRALEDVTGQQDETQHRMDEVVKEKAAVDIELKTSKERVVVLKEEVERLRRQIHALQQESADKEMKIVQMTKAHSSDKNDIQQLNIALDSKQQELELIKRKIGVRGTAGSTPLQSTKNVHRRDSSVFSATPLSRPPSVISDSDREPTTLTQRKERKNSNETPQSSASARISALGKSTRINAIGGSQSASATKPAGTPSGRASVDGSMGPPAMKPRASMASTPTPAGRGALGLGRSSSARATPQSVTPVPHRRVSSVVEQQQTPSQKAKVGRGMISASPAPSSVPEVDEKENVDTSSASAKKRTMIPTLA